MIVVNHYTWAPSVTIQWVQLVQGECVGHVIVVRVEEHFFRFFHHFFSLILCEDGIFLLQRLL